MLFPELNKNYLCLKLRDGSYYSLIFWPTFPQQPQKVLTSIIKISMQMEALMRF